MKSSVTNSSETISLAYNIWLLSLGVHFKFLNLDEFKIGCCDKYSLVPSTMNLCDTTKPQILHCYPPFSLKIRDRMVTIIFSKSEISLILTSKPTTYIEHL
jgi:hypothetical protein